MKRLAILTGCLVLLAIVSITHESRFNVVTQGENTTLQAKDPSTSLLFVGDSMLGRNVEVLMAKFGSEYPFQNMGDLLTSVDGVVANLEGPVMYSHTRTPPQTVRFSFASTTAEVLAQHNITFVSLANNHTYDFGVSAFNETRTILSKANVVSIGNPFAFNDSYIVHAESKEVPIVFVAFNATNPHFDSAKAFAFVKNIERKPDEYMVVLIHGGEEYILHSNAYQKRLYRGFIDAGADVIIGHHPHVVQEVELYKQKPIFYSLGNFIFDQYFSKDVEEGLAVRLTLSKSEAKYEIVPLKSIHSQPQQMNATESAAFLTALATRSPRDIQEALQQGTISIAR